MTHAGAVGREGRGVLLAGRGGSGKSTLALACALAGMEVLADDYVLLETGPPVAHAMQSTAKLTEDSTARLGVAAGSIDPAGFEPTLEGPAKALVEIPAIAPGKMSRRLEVIAIVAPTLPPLTSPFIANTAKKDEVSVRMPAARSVSAAGGLLAIAPSTIVQSGFQGASSLAALAGLVRSVPSYALELCPDPTANATAVDRLVAELG
jgi:energy-coupling factor transporter ATP-binding protein EcfA2